MVKKKHGGRTVGSKNKISEAMRATLCDALQGEIDGLKERFSSLHNTQRCELLVKFLPYIVPKLATEISITEQPPTRFEFDVEICERIDDQVVVTDTIHINNDKKIDDWYKENEL